MPHPEFRWRAEINAIEFRPCGHRGSCVVHKLAIRTIVGFSPDAQDCLAFSRSHSDALVRAASAKIADGHIPVDKSFNLNSREIRAAISRSPRKSDAGKTCS